LFSDPMMLEFGLGVLIAYGVRLGLPLPSWPKTLAAISVILFAIGGYLCAGGHQIFGFTRVATFGLAGGAAIYAVVAAELAGARFPASLQYLGGMSYSLYLWHLPLLAWLASLAGESGTHTRLPGPALWVLWLAIVLLISAASYEFIERWLRLRAVPRNRLVPFLRGATRFAMAASLLIAAITVIAFALLRVDQNALEVNVSRIQIALGKYTKDHGGFIASPGTPISNVEKTLVEQGYLKRRFAYWDTPLHQYFLYASDGQGIYGLLVRTESKAWPVSMPNIRWCIIGVNAAGQGLWGDPPPCTF
jgi:hypothetical protein